MMMMVITFNGSIKDCSPVKCGGASSKLIQYDNAVGSGLLRNGGGPNALHQEGALSADVAIICTCIMRELSHTADNEIICMCIPTQLKPRERCSPHS